MEILELIRLVSNPLNKISIDIISEKSVFDYLLLSAPTAIGILALRVSYCSIKTAAATQRASSLTQARIEIATKLKYERLNAMRDLTSKLSASLEEFMMLSYRLKALEDEIKHYKDNLSLNVSELLITRAGVFDENTVKLGVVKTLSYTLQTYLDVKAHVDVLTIIKEIEGIVGGKEPCANINSFVSLVKKFSREMYVIINKEWGDILAYPFDESHS